MSARPLMHRKAHAHVCVCVCVCVCVRCGGACTEVRAPGGCICRSARHHLLSTEVTVCSKPSGVAKGVRGVAYAVVERNGGGLQSTGCMPAYNASLPAMYIFGT